MKTWIWWLILAAIGFAIIIGVIVHIQQSQPKIYNPNWHGSRTLPRQFIDTRFQ